MQLIHAEKTLAQGYVAVHLVQISVDCLDQIVIDGFRHFCIVQGGFQCSRIMPGVRKEAELFELALQRGRDGIFIFAHPVVILLVGILPQTAVCALQKRHQRPARQRVRPAFAVRGIREMQFRIAQGGTDPVRRAGDLLGSGQERFAFGA